MSQQVRQCPNCKNHVQVDLAQLAIKASRLQCWWCGIVEDAAAYELSQPGISQETKDLWTLIGVGTVLFGLYKFVEHYSA